MDKKTFFILSLIVIICFGLFLYNHPFNINFEYIDSIEINEKDFNDAIDCFPEYTWMTIIDSDLSPFWNEEYVNNRFNINVKNSFPIDKENYSYILTFGYELNKFYVCANAPGNEKYMGLIPKQFNGIAKFKKEDKSNNIYIYRIKKLNVVNNFKFLIERDERYKNLIN